jgi:hypothetical protein
MEVLGPLFSVALAAADSRDMTASNTTEVAETLPKRAASCLTQAASLERSDFA